MFTDTHFHLGSDSFENPDEVLNKARKEGVHTFIISGCSRKEMGEALSIAERHSDVFVTVGYHPEYADQTTDFDFQYFKSILSHPKVVGIGEIGLDYHYGKENKEKQKELFRKQLKLATQLNLPVVIHTRDAIQDTYDIVKDYPVKGVLHCFNESYEMARCFLNLGFYFGIGGVLTFKNSKLYEVVEKIPLTSLLLETDSPYLAPEPFRGKENGPWNIPIIAERLAQVKKISLGKVKEVTYQNALSLFDLKKNL